jgi:hypothetical protein
VHFYHLVVLRNHRENGCHLREMFSVVLDGWFQLRELLRDANKTGYFSSWGLGMYADARESSFHIS